MELTDTAPDVNVHPSEYLRLLGFPRDFVLDGRPLELANWARTWYATHGRPWIHARQAGSLQVNDDSILIDDVLLTGEGLRKPLQLANAHDAILVALGAGPQLEEEARRLWQEGKPDEYFFLEVFGSAVVECLTTLTGARLCDWAERNNMAVLPHYSPGYPKWDIVEQPRLLELLRRRGDLPGRLEVLPSGMVRPKKSLLAVFGLTHHVEMVRRLTELVPCENCIYVPCQFRRAPYLRAPDHSRNAVPLDRNAKYTVNTKALRKWADERLSLDVHSDATVDAVFQFEGTTCANMGRSMLFHYHVTLGRKDEGYPIREQHCGPAPQDTGHTYMCRYLDNAENLMTAVEREKPLLGQPLNDVLSWRRPTHGAGCYCEPGDRKHKWGLVFETIHYALSQKDSREEFEPQRAQSSLRPQPKT